MSGIKRILTFYVSSNCFELVKQYKNTVSYDPLAYPTAFFIRAFQLIASCDICYGNYFNDALKTTFKKDRKMVLKLKDSPNYGTVEEFMAVLKACESRIKKEYCKEITRNHILQALILVRILRGNNLHDTHKHYLFLKERSDIFLENNVYQNLTIPFLDFFYPD